MDWTPDTIVFLIGLAFCGLVACQAVLGVYGMTSQLVAERRMFKVRLRTLEAELDVARQRRRITPRLAASWQGFRPFVVRAKVAESRHTTSLYLVPQDRRPLPAFFPGQFMTLRLNLRGRPEPVTRCYSLSDRPREDFYRCTIKDLVASGTSSDGDRASAFLNRELREGDVVEVRAPAGEFVLELFDRRPAILLAGGIGITPLMSMIHAVLHEQTQRQLILIYGVRNSEDHVFRGELEQLESEHENLKVITCYSRPLPADRPGKDFALSGHVTIDLLREVLPSSNFDFYLCGPPPFLTSLIDGLRKWGVPVGRIRFERFGHRTPSADDSPGKESIGSRRDAADAPVPPDAGGPRIRLARSNRELQWSEDCESILECAERSGVRLAHGCRKGRCGTCAVSLVEGAVSYTKPVEHSLTANECLTCSACPDGDVVLDT